MRQRQPYSRPHHQQQHAKVRAADRQQMCQPNLAKLLGHYVQRRAAPAKQYLFQKRATLRAIIQAQSKRPLCRIREPCARQPYALHRWRRVDESPVTA